MYLYLKKRRYTLSKAAVASLFDGIFTGLIFTFSLVRKVIKRSYLACGDSRKHAKARSSEKKWPRLMFAVNSQKHYGS
jgi:hypothetical protein